MLGVHAIRMAGPCLERILGHARGRKGSSGADRVAVVQRRLVDGRLIAQGRGSAILNHGVAHLGGAVPRRGPSQISPRSLGCRVLPLGRVVAVVLPGVAVAVAVSRLVGVGVRLAETEAIRDHEVVLVEVDLVLVVENIVDALPLRERALVAVAALHGAVRSLRPPEALSPPSKPRCGGARSST